MRIVTIGLMLNLAFGSAALAQGTMCPLACDAEAVPEVGIVTCTQLIQSGKLRGEKLAAALATRADLQYANGDSEGALEDYDRATRVHPAYADAYYNRGHIFDERREHSKAIAEYTKAIEIEPRYEYLTNRAASYLALEQYGRAIADYTQAVSIRPGDSGSYFRRGNAHASMGERDAAIADFAKAIETAQETYARIVYLARLYHVQGLKEQALTQYRAALARAEIEDQGRKMLQDYMDRLLTQ
jgi:tetratricopeptide (TPR) repeat protein